MSYWSTISKVIKMISVKIDLMADSIGIEHLSNIVATNGQIHQPFNMKSSLFDVKYILFP